MVPIPPNKTVQFKPLHPTFAAECSGVDFSKPVPQDVFEEVAAGVAKYGVLVFRKAGLDDARHVDFSSMFGELDDSSPYIAKGRKHRLPFTQLFDVGNVGEDDKPFPKDSYRFQMNLGNSLFHCDSSFNPRRAGLSILRAHELPPPGTGGATEFADSRTAYGDLDEETKQQLEDYVVRHSLFHSRKLAAPDCEFFKEIDPEKQFMSRHKLVQTHEASGRKTMYISHHCHSIEGLPKEEGQAIIKKLLAWASQPKYVVRVDWENNGDIIIWDNTSVMHRATGGSFAGVYKRDMRRTTVHDMSSNAWGLNEKTAIQVGLP